MMIFALSSKVNIHLPNVHLNCNEPLSNPILGKFSKKSLENSSFLRGCHLSNGIKGFNGLSFKNFCHKRHFRRNVINSKLRNENIKLKYDESVTEADVVIIGSGIGGLCCGALLAKYGLDVVICESHSIPGGAAHTFERKGYKFDSGPSFHAGLSMKRSLNPLKQILDIIDEKVDCITYKTWIGYLPEGRFVFTADGDAYRKEIERVGGKVALREWMDLENRILPLAQSAAALPASALRNDIFAVLTLWKFLPGMVQTLPWVGQLLKPFSNIVDAVVKDTFLRRMINLECFVLSGMLADSTITAEMAFMFFERNRPNSTIDYPMGGGESIVNALVKGLTKFNGKLLLNTHVESIHVSNGKATGVMIRKKSKSEDSDSESFQKDANKDKKNGSVGREGEGRRYIKARMGVISNASIWDTVNLLHGGEGDGVKKFKSMATNTKETNSFMHLHLGIDASGLDSNLECHHLIVNDWENGIDSPQNVCIISIPSVFDPSLSPAGKHVIHAYTAGNEPYDIWKGLDRKSEEYIELKKKRSEVLWKALEKVIPDIRDRVELELTGTPLTHERFLRRNRGTYGPAIKAGLEAFPGAKTEIPNLYCCGDSTMPGIGVPAVAASAFLAANSILPVTCHLDMLETLERVANE